MRKPWKFLLFLSVTVVLLCTTALAADSTSGICKVESTDSSKVSLSVDGTATPVDTDGDGTAETNVYVGAEKVEVAYSSATADAQYLIVVTNEASDTLTENNIVYINQEAGATSGGVTFTVYPSSLSADTTYYVYLSSDSDTSFSTLTQVGTFSYYADYMLGDVNDDKTVTASDAAIVLQHVVHKIELTGAYLTAADVDGNSGVTASDAAVILQYVVHKIAGFD